MKVIINSLRNTLFLIGVIALTGLLSHISYIFNDFTWLDHNDIQSKTSILPFEQIYKAFITPFGRTAFYRPLVTLSYSLDYLLYGEKAWGYHLTNVLLHIALSIMAFFFLQVFFSVNKRIAFIAALIITVHPAGIIVVGSITQRQEILFIFFTMATLYFYIKNKYKRSTMKIFLTQFFWLMALFSKETALVIIPGFIFLWEISIYRQIHKRSDLKRTLLIWTSGILITLIYLFMRFGAVPQIWATKMPILSISEWISLRFTLTTRILTILILPLKPSFSDVVTLRSIYSLYNLISMFLIVLLISFLYINHTKPNKKLIILCFLLTISAGLNFIPVPRVASPHYAYLPLIPFSIALSVLLSDKHLFRYVLFSWIIICVISSFHSGFQFKNDLMLFSKEVNRSSDFLEAHQYLGDYYYSNKDLGRAAKHYQISLQKINNHFAYIDRYAVLNNFAGVRMEQNKLEEAESLLSQIEKPTLTMVYNRAVIAYKIGDHKRVIHLLSQHINQWQDKQPLYMLASSLHLLGREEEEHSVLKRIRSLVSDEERKKIDSYLINNTLKEN